MLNTRIGENYNANDVINSNDLRKRILNIDSRFRTNQSSPSTDFSFRLAHPYKNLIRIRLASVEIPNMHYVFSAKKNNTSFKLKTADINGIDRIVLITIPDGNYTSDELINEIQSQFDNKLRIPYGIFLSITLNTINAKTTITNNGIADYLLGPPSSPTQVGKPLFIDFITSLKCKNRDHNFGLGYILGFRNKLYKLTTLISSTPFNIYSVTSEGCIDVVGDNYMFLAINDLYSVEQKTNEDYLQVLAKIIIREDKQAVIYDDGSSFLSNEIVFPSPTDLSILNVKLVDPYGDPIDLCSMNFSFTLEITEVLNTRLYDFYRNYIWLGTVPSVPYKSVQGSAQTLLKGIGPPF
jgi:hypothetical protein